jgi:hypothetical protein
MPQYRQCHSQKQADVCKVAHFGLALGVSRFAVILSVLLANATQKLKKRTCIDQVQAAVAEAVKDFLNGNAMLDALRTGSPDLHEKFTGKRYPATAVARMLGEL